MFAPRACFHAVGVSPIRTGDRVGVSNSPNTFAIFLEFGPGGSILICGRSDPSCSFACNSAHLGPYGSRVCKKSFSVRLNQVLVPNGFDNTRDELRRTTSAIESGDRSSCIICGLVNAKCVPSRQYERNELYSILDTNQLDEIHHVFFSPLSYETYLAIIENGTDCNRE